VTAYSTGETKNGYKVSLPLGLDGNLAAAIGYPFSILAIVCLVMEKENRFVKFHALQSILLHVAMIIVAIWPGILLHD